MIIMNIGAGVYLEMPYEDALDLIVRKERIFLRKTEVLNEQVFKNKSYLKLSEEIIDKINKSQSIYSN
jgi:prefoldin subunit 5